MFKHYKSTSEGIVLHDQEDFNAMHKAGKTVALILDEISDQVQPGVTSLELDEFVMQRIEEYGVKSGTIGYRGYRYATCISVNHVTCHGVPNTRKLRQGDILNIDVTIIHNGWYGDSSRMYGVGSPSLRNMRLIQVTHDALMLGIEQVKPGNTFGDLGFVINRFVRKNRMSVVKVFCGHGLGRKFHQEPNVMHYGTPGSGAIMEEGMFFTIEPIVSLGNPDVTILNDGWTAVTKDRSPSAQYEHAVGVTGTGYEIFTLSPGNRYSPTNI